MDEYMRRASKRLRANVVEDQAGHWMWTASIRITAYRLKYGKIYYKGKSQEAHRVSYELFVGPIPEGYEVDHLCRVTLCVNPTHLEAVPPKVNLERRVLNPKTPAQDKCPFCSQGKPCPKRDHQADRLENKKLAMRRWRARNPGKEPWRRSPGLG